MNIMTEQVTAYLDELYQPLNPFLEQLRVDAQTNKVPIILRDTEMLLGNLLRLRKPKRILEIGTAVGYSAIYFASVCEGVEITTLEVSEESVAIAKENIQKAGMSGQIEVITGDAKESLLLLDGQVQEKERQLYDFIFIDAAKGQYQAFWDACQPLCAPQALLVSDNVLFKGMTASDDFVLNRKYNTIIRRMREYLHNITNLETADTCVLAVGDGVAVSFMKG